jgi:hypothetical protein
VTEQTSSIAGRADKLDPDRFKRAEANKAVEVARAAAVTQRIANYEKVKAGEAARNKAEKDRGEHT